MSTALSLPPIDLVATAAAELAQQAREAGNGPRERAVNKAALALHSGVTVVPTAGGFLLPSSTRGGVVHRLSTVHGCSCEAGQAGRTCWHQAVIDILERAAMRTLPAVKPLGTRTAEARARIVAEMDELYA